MISTKSITHRANYILLFSFLFIFQSLYAQDINEAIKVDATKMSQAFIDGNYNLFIDYTHPNLIAFSGGKQKMQAVLKNQMDKMANDGFHFNTVEIGDPVVTKLYNGQYQTLVPKTTIMTYDGRRILSKDYLFGFSDNEGSKWTFVEAAKIKTAAAKEIFPDFETDIEIPDKEAPVELGSADEAGNDETIYEVEELSFEDDIVNKSGFEIGYIIGFIFFFVFLLALVIGLFFLIRHLTKTKTVVAEAAKPKPSFKKTDKILCANCETENNTESKYCRMCGYAI